jgi:alpha-ribazole phosphatase/probable phosphoglycerate mutase
MNTDHTLVDLLRHGEVAGGHLLRGCRTDQPLSNKGWEQLRMAVAGDSGWQRIISSPMRRCQEFAEETARRLDLPLRVEDGLRELDFGAWDGLPMDRLWAEHGQEAKAFLDNPLSLTPPDAEPITTFQERVLQSWRRVLAAHAGEHLLIVAHGAVNRLILSHVLSMPLHAMFRLEVAHACLSRVRAVENSARVVFHGGQV